MRDIIWRAGVVVIFVVGWGLALVFFGVAAFVAIENGFTTDILRGVGVGLAVAAATLLVAWVWKWIIFGASRG